MSRLQKKCVIGATGFHLLLLGILIVGPAFLSQDKVDATPVLEFIPMNVTDAAVSGGGSPRPPAPQPPAPQTQPQVQQPAPAPSQPDVPPKVEATKATRPVPDSLEPRPEKQPHKVRVSDKVINPRDRKTSDKPANDTQAASRASAERKQQVATALKNIQGGLTSSTKVEMPDGPVGPGGGGASYANYAQEVRRIYTEAWRIPDDVTDDEATVKVSVTIARAGHVISSRILQTSGSRRVDDSIQATLDRVTFVRAFPEGAREAQRTFTISFSLKAKKLG
jgi:protein TonB